MELFQALESCTLALLRKMAARHGLSASDAVLRQELAAQISRRLGDQAYLGSVLGSLSPAETHALQVVRRGGWEERGYMVDRGASGAEGPGSGQPGPVLSLMHSALLFRSFQEKNGWRGEVYFVPEEFRAAMDAALPALPTPAAVVLTAEEEPAVALRCDPATDAFVLLSFLSRNPRSPHNGTISRANLVRLEEEAAAPSVATAGSWEERWRFLIHLGLAGGWIRRQERRLVPGRLASRILAGPLRQVAAGLLEGYLRDAAWDDIRAAGNARQTLGSRPPRQTTGRRMLLHILERLDEAQWMKEDAFLASVRATDPDLLREDYSSPSWGFVDTTTEAELFGEDSWGAVEGEWISYLIRGPLHWLGLVDWGASRDGRLVAFRRGQDQVAQAAPELSEIAILGGEALQAGGRTTLGQLLRLETFLNVARGEGRSRYQLSRESATAGVDGGGSWGELRALLEDFVAGGPAAVPTGLLEDWESEHSRYRLELALVVLSANPDDADGLEGHPRVSSFLEERLGPGAHLAAPGSGHRLLASMGEVGIRPQISSRVRRALSREAELSLEQLKECLFALKMLASLDPAAVSSDAVRAAGQLEAMLDPEDVLEVKRRIARETRRGAQ